jgi:hypothetical protein
MVKTLIAVVVVVVFLLVLMHEKLSSLYLKKSRIKAVIETKRTFWFSDFELTQIPNTTTKQLLDNNKDPAYRTTVISVYFELTKSKHSVKEYNKWIKYMTDSVKSPLAIILSHDDYLRFKKLRKHAVTKFYVIEDIWLIMKELEFERNASYLRNFVQDQNDIDPENFRHNPNLYAIWDLKSYFCHKISQENPFGSSFFIYTDAGAWHNGVLPDWPDTDFVKNSLVQFLDDRVLFGQVNKYKYFDERNDIIEGTFFAGSAKALKEFYNNFFSIHDQRLKEGLFVGKDQTIMNLLAFKYYPHTVIRLATWELNCTFEYDPWRFFQYFFSANTSLHCTDDRLSLLIEL